MLKGLGKQRLEALMKAALCPSVGQVMTAAL